MNQSSPLIKSHGVRRWKDKTLLDPDRPFSLTSAENNCNSNAKIRYFLFYLSTNNWNIRYNRSLNVNDSHFKVNFFLLRLRPTSVTSDLLHIIVEHRIIISSQRTIEKNFYSTIVFTSALYIRIISRPAKKLIKLHYLLPPRSQVFQS